MKRMGYRAAVRWIWENDDTTWMDEEYGLPCVTACLVADMFDVPVERVVFDLRKLLDGKR